MAVADTAVTDMAVTVYCAAALARDSLMRYESLRIAVGVARHFASHRRNRAEAALAHRRDGRGAGKSTRSTGEVEAARDCLSPGGLRIGVFLPFASVAGGRRPCNAAVRPGPMGGELRGI